MTAYEVQLARTRRCLNTIKRRLAEYSKGNVSEEPLFLLDTIFNFFCECHNIKDMITKDASNIVDKDPIEYIRENLCLQICADICNLKKHLELDPKKWWTKEKYKVNFKGVMKEKLNEFEVIIVSDKGKTYEFFSLAGEYINKWETFIKNHVK